MSQIITVTPETALLARLFPDFDIHGRDPLWVRKSVKQAVEQALALELDPNFALKVDTDETSRINFSLDGQDSTLVVAACKRLGTPEGLPGYAAYCRGLLHALAARPKAELSLAEVWEGAEELGRVVAALNATRTQPYRARPEQIMFYKQLRDSFAEGKIALAEAATGVGKTLAILTAGVEAIRIRQTRMLIAVPTLALSGQFADTHQELKAADPTTPPLRVIFGRQEFISPQALIKFLAEAKDEIPDRPAVEAWLAAKGPAPAGVSITMPWLRASLQELAPQFPIDEVRLNQLTDASDEGNQAYHAQFDSNRDQLPEIMVCSHAMAAIDMQRRIWLSRQDADYRGLSTVRYETLMGSRGQALEVRKEAAADGNAINAELGLMLAQLTDKTGMLPAYQILVVDEAHQFEANASLALSNDISLREVVRNMHDFRKNGGRLGEPRIDEAVRAIQILMDWGKQADEMVLLANTDPYLQGVKSALRALHTAISGLKESEKLNAIGQRALVLLRRAAVALKLAIDGGYAYLKYSPVRTYPQVLVGRKTVDNVLSLMWNSVEAGAAVSATLYLKHAGGTVSGDYQRQLLAIPAEKLKTCSPVAPLWLLRPVKEVWTPTALRDWLIPPKTVRGGSTEQYDKDEIRWLSELKEELQHRILPSAAGGTLVLMTSLRAREKLELMLFDAGYSPQLVSTVPGVSLLKQREIFLRKSHANEKPIWLAVGGAWTGLDVGGHDPYAKLFGEALPAHLDNVLTDLVIPRIPFKLNRSITHSYRVENKKNVPWEIFEATFLFFQALGRLVRREGLPENRRIWVLDSRINNENGYVHIKAALNRYLVQKKLVKSTS